MSQFLCSLVLFFIQEASPMFLSLAPLFFLSLHVFKKDVEIRRYSCPRKKTAKRRGLLAHNHKSQPHTWKKLKW